MRAVSLLSYTPVKGLALVHPDEVYVDAHGVADNRRFYLIREDGRRYEITRDGRTALVVPAYDSEGETLSLHFPDGAVVEGRVGEGVYGWRSDYEAAAGGTGMTGRMGWQPPVRWRVFRPLLAPILAGTPAARSVGWRRYYNGRRGNPLGHVQDSY